MKTTSKIISALALVLAIGLNTGCNMEEEVQTGSSEISGRPYFEVFKGNDKRWYFNFSAANHEIMLQSQSYSSRTAALGGVLSVQNNAGDEGRFEQRTASNGDSYFVLKAANGQIIGLSEMYSSASNAAAGADAVSRNMDDYLALWNSRTGARFVITEGTNGQFYFRLHAKNGATVLQSEGYTSEAAALNGTFSVHSNGQNEGRYDVRQARDGRFYFNIKATNGQVVGTSQMYSTKGSADRAVDAIIDTLPAVELL